MMKKLQEEPLVDVGIMSAEQLHFEFHGTYVCQQNGRMYRGVCKAELFNNRLLFDRAQGNEFLFLPISDNDEGIYFSLNDVTIGVGFHWERNEEQAFNGALRLLVDDGKIVAVNRISVERYLYSVIASEMSATASLALLKAHAVISRSWLLAPMLNPPRPSRAEVEQRSEHSLVKWYERDAHALFDVCADDHCQRYQGIARAHTPLVRQAIAETRGEVLTYDAIICDARFSKACGGKSETFDSCWDDEAYPYLSSVVDCTDPDGSTPDLRVEANADAWIRDTPDAFCNTTDPQILSQVLNSYDQETADFFRWQVAYSPDELSALLLKRSGIDFGTVEALLPLTRGASGRITRLRIVGTRTTFDVGKELEIRRWLSESHLYSSAFVVDRSDNGDFILRGAGWGHGVGLCQIGAAVMGAKGYPYRAILQHYFRGAEIEPLY